MLVNIAQWMLAPLYKARLSGARESHLWTKLISAILHHLLGDGEQFPVAIFSREIQSIDPTLQVKTENTVCFLILLYSSNTLEVLPTVIKRNI